MKPFSSAWKWLWLPVTLLYQVVTTIRNSLYDWQLLPLKKVSVPVISIGNLTVGGTGKTPVSAWLANEFLKSGKRVAVVSRGYHRSGKGFVLVSDGKQILVSAEIGGDEPVELAESCPGLVVAVGEDRFLACQNLLKTHPVDVIILDDGFQHRRLHRDFDIVLQDWPSWSANRFHLPSGPFRESLRGFSRAGWIGLTKWPAESHPPQEIQSLGIPMDVVTTTGLNFFHLNTGAPLSVEKLSESPVIALAGIANPAHFFRELRAAGINVKKTFALADHARITEEKISEAVAGLEQNSIGYLIMTAKDAVKVRGVKVPEKWSPIVARQSILPLNGLRKLLLSVTDHRDQD